eukprot:CAMPEP_0183334564 /NCGR_PEP_ID=MMETSP0164_2-20130417/3137_1 /TAXON_ID=221442 /ORGANISM="Coccolithus pelagicus ssp braarudi, Strain PLY182g" /LENGTH=93 /DNA_ID=CAMNT_0025503733 /DNA_START=42 /DNA_END=319 /DNA_ORIENTATION=+
MSFCSTAKKRRYDVRHMQQEDAKNNLSMHRQIAAVHIHALRARGGNHVGGASARSEGMGEGEGAGAMKGAATRKGAAGCALTREHEMRARCAR